MLDSDRMTDSFKNRINNRTKQNKKRPDNPTVALCIPNEFFTFPFSVFFFPNLFSFFLPLLYFSLKEGIYIIREKTKKYEKSGGTRVWKTIFLYLDFDSWILFFFSRVRLLPSQILFLKFHFLTLESWKRLKGDTTQKKRKDGNCRKWNNEAKSIIENVYIYFLSFYIFRLNFFGG